MRGKLDTGSLDLVFREARTANGFTGEKISEALMREMYELVKMGPTSANCSPARFLFLVTPEAKEQLRPALSSGNAQKTMDAPLTVVVGYDTKFYENLPELFPHAPDAKTWFTSSAAFAEETAFRNGTLQGAYLIMAARALGLDAGPMSGFDQAKVNAAFWPDGAIKVNFLCNIGIGDDSKLFGRHPRLSFERACRIL
jgi:3-hydroxypropanoate dehydrogenase